MPHAYHVHPISYLDDAGQSRHIGSSGDSAETCGQAGKLALIRSVDWQKAEPGMIDVFPWAADQDPYFPISSFYMLHESDMLYVLLMTRGEEEKEPRAEVEINQGPVHLDSCLEFFLAPYSDSDLYFNFEVNAKGYIKLAAGTSGQNRIRINPAGCGDLIIQSLPQDLLESLAVRAPGDWGVFLKMPLTFLDRAAEKLLPAAADLTRSADSMRMNMYKCGDETAKPHYACWSSIGTAEPDFHRPEYFGKIILV